MRRFFTFICIGVALLASTNKSSAQTGAPTFITNSTSLLSGANFNIGGTGKLGLLTVGSSGQLTVDGSGNLSTTGSITGTFIGNGSGITGISGLLSHITETYGTAAPYSSGNAGEQLLASGTDANIDVALQPKGTGALEAQIADGTAAGGNKRGATAVDWQMDRGSSSQVASGTESTVAGGYSNTASGNGSTVSGGYSNTASGNGSTVAGGENNIASGILSSVSGGVYANAALFGQNAQASSHFNTNGDAQTSVYTANSLTSNATAATLFLDGLFGSHNLTIPTKGAWVFKVQIIGKTQSPSATVGAWEINGAVLNDAGTATIIGTNATTIFNTPSGWGVPTVTGSGANMVITVTGKASTTIYWVARIQTAETIY